VLEDLFYKWNKSDYHYFQTRDDLKYNSTHASRLGYKLAEILDNGMVSAFDERGELIHITLDGPDNA